MFFLLWVKTEGSCPILREMFVLRVSRFPVTPTRLPGGRLRRPTATLAQQRFVLRLVRIAHVLAVVMQPNDLLRQHPVDGRSERMRIDVATAEKYGEQSLRPEEDDNKEEGRGRIHEGSHGGKEDGRIQFIHHHWDVNQQQDAANRKKSTVNGGVAKKRQP